MSYKCRIFFCRKVIWEINLLGKTYVVRFWAQRYGIIYYAVLFIAYLCSRIYWLIQIVWDYYIMKQKRIPLVGEQYLVPFILITSLFFLWGFAHAILDVLNKHFQELLDITKAHSAFIQAMMYMGYFVMAIPAGLFISRFGYRRGV